MSQPRTIYDRDACYWCDHKATTKVRDFPSCAEHERYFEREREHRERRRLARVRAF